MALQDFSSLTLSLSICFYLENDYSKRKQNKWRSKLLFHREFPWWSSQKSPSGDRPLDHALWDLVLSFVKYSQLSMAHGLLSNRLLMISIYLKITFLCSILNVVFLRGFGRDFVTNLSRLLGSIYIDRNNAPRLLKYFTTAFSFLHQ